MATENRTYTVAGMTCEHCKLSVSEEVSALAGISRVEVDLPSGRLDVTGDDLDDAVIKSAVQEAGYAVAV